MDCGINPSAKGKREQERVPKRPSIVWLLSQTKRRRQESKAAAWDIDCWINPSPKNRKWWPRGGQWADCSPKQKREKTGKKDCQLGQSLDWSVAKKGIETGKGGKMQSIDWPWPTTLPNKKGEDRKERLPVSIIVQSIPHKTKKREQERGSKRR